MSILSAFLLAGAAQSVWDDPAPTGRWAAGTKQLASELLPAEMAVDVVSHVVGGRIGQGGSPSSVRFEGRPTVTSDGFCTRKSYYVWIFQKGGAGPGEPQDPVVLDKVRFGGCDGIFANVNRGASLADAKRVLRWLEWAQATALRKGPLPFKLTCKSETPVDRCVNGARSVLAALPIDKVTIITRARQRPPHNWDVAVVETAPGQEYWQTKIDATPGHASIDLTWKIPAPF